MSVDDLVGMRQLEARLRQEVEQLSSRCIHLQHDVHAQIQARRACESQLFQVERARSAYQTEIVALRSQLHQERLRADAMCKAGGAVLNPGLIPLRIVAVGASRTDVAGAPQFSRNGSSNPSKPPEPSPGRVPPLSQYPDEIPDKDREVIRARMLKDRGPNTPAPAPAAPAEDMENVPPARSPCANVSGRPHDDGEMTSLKMFTLDRIRVERSGNLV